MKTILLNRNASDYSSIHHEVVSHIGEDGVNRKFAIHVELRNGDPLGFNYKCCLDIMTSDGTFKHVMDNDEAGVPYSNNYVASPELKYAIMDRAVKAWKKIIKNLY